MSNQPQYSDCVVVETTKNPKFSVIWLHGLGADGHDFEPIVSQFKFSAELQAAGIRFIFPHAATMPVTINGGMPMRAWYDIRGMDLRRDQDQEGIFNSATRINALLDQEISMGRSAGQLVLAGFSQGGAMALHAGLRYEHRLAGIMALSCYLLFPEQIDELQNAATTGMEVFVGHGIHDPVVPFSVGKKAAKQLRGLGYQVEWHPYPAPHSVYPEEIADIGRWLSRVF